MVENSAHTGLWSLVHTECTELYAKHLMPDEVGTPLIRRNPTIK